MLDGHPKLRADIDRPHLRADDQPLTAVPIDPRRYRYAGMRREFFRPGGQSFTEEHRPAPTEDYRPLRSFTPTMATSDVLMSLEDQLRGTHSRISPPTGGKGGVSMPAARTLDPISVPRNIFRTVPVAPAGPTVGTPRG